MRIVALVDISIHGHHLAFMRLFAKTLLELQYRVVVLIPQAHQVDDWIKINSSKNYINFRAVEFQDVDKSYTIFGQFNHTATVFSKWHNVAKAIKKAENNFQFKVEFVFFAWLDSFLANYLVPQAIDAVFPYKWSGLYFHPRHLRINPERLGKKVGISEIDTVLTTTHCKNVVIHDAGIALAFENRLQKKVIVFPEIADDTPPDMSYELAQNIQKNANGRIVIGMIGLEKRKGTMTLIGLAKRASAEKFYFVFAGAIAYDTYAADEVNEIKSFLNAKPENCFFHIESIQEGAMFNAVFCSFDIPFIVYNNFASTSNLVTKAAIFKKHVLATERYIIGEDVKAFNLGLTVEEGNIEQCLQAIEMLREKIISKEPFPESFDIYQRLQGLDKLSEKFTQVLQNIS